MKPNKQTQKKSTDSNLALISIILGAASFTNTIFTGIPAIIIGIIALKKKIGNQNQAKLGILFGVIGSLLLIPIVLIAVYFLKTPFKEQFGTTAVDAKNLHNIAEKLESYKSKNDHFPNCREGSADTCTEWNEFKQSESITIDYPVEVEVFSASVEDRPAGTLVYAQKTTCFVNTPAEPGYLDEDKRVDVEDYAALVFFHAGGRSCISVGKN